MQTQHAAETDPRSGRGPPIVGWRVTFGDGSALVVEADSEGAARAIAQEQALPHGIPPGVANDWRKWTEFFERSRIVKVEYRP